MPSTAPTLTWKMTALRNPGTPASPQIVLDTLALAVGDLTRWEVKSSAAGYIEIGPIAASATPNIRIVVAFGVDAAQVLAPHSNVADVLYMGIAPDGGTLSLPLGAAAPYGAARWSGYWKCSGVISGAAPVDSLFCIGSDETVSFWFKETTPDDWYGGVGGCILDPPTDGDGEGTPGRIYGMMTGGGDVLNASFWGNLNYFTSSGSTNVSPQLGVFMPTATTTFAQCDRFTLNPAGTPKMETVGGTVVSMPHGVYYQTGPTNFVGIYRQMRYTTDATMRTVIQDSGSVDQSYYVSGASGTAGDCLSFDNG